MKWPKEYLRAFRDWHHNGRDLWNDDEVAEFFDDLHKVGALKDPPKPKEWWICDTCECRYLKTYIIEGNTKCRNGCIDPTLIHVREVTEEPVGASEEDDGMTDHEKFGVSKNDKMD